ncbi:glycosyltransferase [Paramuribaculum intestinale]|nr:glycosyltransferase [Paramuribaculum intestinale]
MGCRISVVTVCYNAVDCIEDTMLSVLGQTYPDIEYIIIDGGSTDGTVDIIKKYADRLAYWISEPDKGIYDAMNKGIAVSTGDYINFMNAGDLFVSSQTVESVFADKPDADVLYGNALVKDKYGSLKHESASNDVSLLENTPIFRHGASFIKSAIHKRFPFEIEKSDKYGYALDFLNLHTMYVSGCSFAKINKDVIIYEEQGVSSNALKSIRYNYLISRTTSKFSIKSYIKYLLRIIKYSILFIGILKKVWSGIYYLNCYLMNSLIALTPVQIIRHGWYKLMGMKIGSGTSINMRQYIISPESIAIGSHSHINRGCLIDGRGGCRIGDSVSISYNVSIITGGHDIQSNNFSGKYLPINIGDNVWIGANAIILQGVSIGSGAVVCAGAVVTNDIDDHVIVGGVPAKKIGVRNTDLHYQCRWTAPFV